MRPLFYSVMLLALLAGAVLLLRAVDPGPRERPQSSRSSRATSPHASTAPPSSMPGYDAADDTSRAGRLVVGTELMELWHPREAARALEGAVGDDSLGAVARMRLIECYSEPLMDREDAARREWRNLARAWTSPDTSLVAGIRALYLDRDYVGAAGHFAAVARTDSSAEAHYHLALAYFGAGRLDDADRIVNDLLSDDDSQGRVMALSVRILVARGEIDVALERARDLARIYTEQPYPYVLLSQVELRAGHVANATEFCTTALTLDARYIPAIVTRANLYAREGNYDAARVAFEKLLLFDDDVLRAAGYEGIAWTDFLSGNFDDGVEAMDEAIRNAIVAGSVRRGLSYAARLVDYLCELGQADGAEVVIERWITGFGTIPETLGRLRVDLLEGRYDVVRHALVQVEVRKDWLRWARVMSVDTAELGALMHIGAGNSRRALDVLDADSTVSSPTASGAASRHAFLAGYAAFESGDAEAAAGAFDDVRERFFGTEYPYRGDPVLYVQSVFYQAECALGVGDTAQARTSYQQFTDAWGGSPWDLRALSRAREKLKGLDPATP